MLRTFGVQVGLKSRKSNPEVRPFGNCQPCMEHQKKVEAAAIRPELDMLNPAAPDMS